MEAAPRSRQFRLSNWSVTRKVGIVLLLPVVLASTFAVLRINDELNTIADLDAATDQARIIRPMLGFASATEQLAVTTATVWDNQETAGDAEIDRIAGRFDQAAADLQTALRSTGASTEVTNELDAALTAGRAMRNGLRNSSPVAIGQQADEVAARIGNAIARSTSLEEITIQRYFLQLGVTTNARRLHTQQYLLIGSPGADRNPAVRPTVLTTAGGELVLLAQFAQLQPSSALNASVLIDSVNVRLGAFSQNLGEPASSQPVADSLRTSATAYDQTTLSLVDTIDERLAARTAEVRGVVLRDIAIVVTTLLAGLALALAVARSLVVPIRRLRHGALQVAHVDLPNELEVVRSGGATPEATRVDVHTTEEIGQLARAVDDIHDAALHLAGEQARLRLQIGSMFETLSRRSQSLVEQQLTLIEELEHDEDNSERLQSLFRLDHLATRMRRNGDNLLVLAGTALRRGHLPPVPLSDMLWSAVSQVEDYQRVEIGTAPDGIVPGEPAVDVEHLLAELIDNALRYSPPTTPVAVSVARAVDGGYLIEIIDRGLGMSAEDLQTVNEHLASGGEVTVETARRMGLFVVGRLAKRHNITVNLRRTSAMAQQPGITASVHLPGTLVSPVPVSDKTPQLTAPQPPHELPAEPTIAPPRMLVPVPSLALPEHTSSFETSASGLPQRRPAIRVAGPAEREPAILDVETTDPGRGGMRPLRNRTGNGAASQAEPLALPAPAQEEAKVDVWAETETYAIPEPPAPAPAAPTATAAQPTVTGLRPVNGESPTPIYQRMVSEWLVEPATAAAEHSEGTWTSPADVGWAAAAEASNPATSGRTSGGLPIRQPGAQLVPGGLAPATESNQRNPDEIRNSLTRHLSGVRSGRADAQYNDGGLA
ncbi:sensor histidine kinase [Nocardia puris]|uniref:histidine kinase n=1 Tax=Nocardia puris TaxID=208602 RepID=A0A366D3M6_9NOCA|nr:ATP-binding protein [Nocardia puris]MBF6214809.1 sensor histidine kinase [Nocardia puris]MBF6364182.1 sensor histidine kinase [Nocardia puris]MBF6459111.1 sensor histidine kinase [Nocardia puris]RBO84535.1 signal transduction histidine kinase [Nocardia puris]